MSVRDLRLALRQIRAPVFDDAIKSRGNSLVRQRGCRRASSQEKSLSPDVKSGPRPRKGVGAQPVGNRTANRHRWSGRADQGERVSDPQGTRQKSGRNFGIRPARPPQGGWAAAKVSLATVYQKHSSLRTRKRMYRG